MIVFHRHRFIVLRRVLLLLGLLYMYRSVTMWVTALPKADRNYECADKFGSALTVSELIKRVITIVTGFGLSINGNHIYCGDYVYSGHTMILVMGHLVMKHCEWLLAMHNAHKAALFIFSDTPSSFFVLHWLTWINAITGIVLLLLSRGHYSIDVIIAYWLATRMWCVMNYKDKNGVPN